MLAAAKVRAVWHHHLALRDCLHGVAVGGRVSLQPSGAHRAVRTAFAFVAGSVVVGSFGLLPRAVQAEPASKQASRLSDGWKAAVDPSTGKTFYYRGSETTWEKPTPDDELLQSPATEWEAYLDPAGRTYYCNATTGQTSWNKPRSVLRANRGAVGSTLDGDPDAAQGEDKKAQHHTSELLHRLREYRLVDERHRSDPTLPRDPPPDELFSSRAVGFFLFVPGAEVRAEAR